MLKDSYQKNDDCDIDELRSGKREMNQEALGNMLNAIIDLEDRVAKLEAKDNAVNGADRLLDQIHKEE